MNMKTLRAVERLNALAEHALGKHRIITEIHNLAAITDEEYEAAVDKDELMKWDAVEYMLEADVHVDHSMDRRQYRVSTFITLPKEMDMEQYAFDLHMDPEVFDTDNELKYGAMRYFVDQMSGELDKLTEAIQLRGPKIAARFRTPRNREQNRLRIELAERLAREAEEKRLAEEQAWIDLEVAKADPMVGMF